ncbi:PREDICTED: LEAF RUST 10 DISEASE-RESISTANCE LOCUS RECEPTOR-LIKE PROTEIN KINASE-like 2.4 isoform X1 [Ipomoea nil]|uniref:LEAF RUST 10 DISEASE-RESISTANCE LOCUS RECEPTOR-LIKE PROTEIN KINASE-like 2.4 isoform X1 n=1 Tax=Ipomoea nil TaxID=35883 RepID=UPI000900D1E7|nr:PREDICTED: LEAF RUST 10 DISEASE-RESISTANCE LOCUS RECEPTOR-LIKE PROTEIN KINASE-like 2.4 isoform X1 [Ipomoea nil]
MQIWPTLTSIYNYLSQEMKFLISTVRPFKAAYIAGSLISFYTRQSFMIRNQNLSSQRYMDHSNSICPALFVFIILLIQTPETLCQNNGSSGEYEACGEPFNCANIENVGYPFWGGSQPAYCGHPSFELDCSKDLPEITIQSVKYRVVNISNRADTATIARDDLTSNICPSNPRNASLDFNLFSYVSSGADKNISLFYGCTSVSLVSNLFNCNSTGNGLWSRSTGLPSNNNIKCGFEIFVTVTQEAFEALGNASQLASEELLRTSVAGGFAVEWKANNSLCEECRSSGGRCGSNANLISTQFVCYYESKKGLSTVVDIPFESKKGLSTGVKFPFESRKLLAINVKDDQDYSKFLLPTFGSFPIYLVYYPLGIFGIIITLVLIIRCCKRKSDESIERIEAFIRTNGCNATKVYTYLDIKKMTNSFKDKIGEGGFGSVYKGKLPDGNPVAVKLLTDTKGTGDDFINEVASICRTSHVNIVTLVGFCYQKKRALVYEFMPNGSLDKYIGNKGSQNMSCLEWKTLYQIAIGIARGLEYLHRGCNTRIMHFDIKPNNILLDKDFTPKISDFGLAKLCKKEQSIVSLSACGVRGTIGYIAPEVIFGSIGNVSHKSDVYSYGMTVIDMVGVRENVNAAQTSDLYFPNWIYEHLEQGLDFSLEGIIDEEDKEMAMKMILVSLWCIQTNPADRPSIRRVVEMLEGSIGSLQIPPKPVFCPPTEFPQLFSTSSSVTTEI